jgi:putative endonuclease
MYYVYLIKSLADREKIYVGYTTNVLQRLEAHNKGDSIYTKDYLPWALETYICFADKSKAIAFEKYLKSHSGRSFAHKRFW